MDPSRIMVKNRVERDAPSTCRMEKRKMKRERVLCMKSNPNVAVVSLVAAVAWLLCGGAQVVAAESDSKALQCVYISGEVKIPGKYAYTDDLPLSKAIEMAKGVTSKASDKVILRREGTEEKAFKLKAIQQGNAKDTKLKPGDKVFVPRKE
jgi:NADH:ubiquinone oxidoreductase subunit F (NADH-binding)